MNINNVLDEMAYYDSIGKYKLSDKLYVKLARFFNPNDLHGGQSGLQAQQNLMLFTKFMADHPDCAGCFRGSGGPIATGSMPDLLIGMNAENAENFKQQFMDD